MMKSDTTQQNLTLSGDKFDTILQNPTQPNKNEHFQENVYNIDEAPERPECAVKKVWADDQQQRTIDKKQELLANIKTSCWVVAEACRRTKIHRDTYYKWRKTDPEFARRLKDI